MKWVVLLAFCGAEVPKASKTSKPDIMHYRPGEKGYDDLVNNQASDELKAFDRMSKSNNRLPPKFRCDACRLMTFQLEKRFWDDKPMREFRAKQKDKIADAVANSDILDKACGESAYSGAGIFEEEGTVLFTGDGLAKPHKGAISHGGWPSRVAGECKELVFDAFEEERVIKLLEKKSKKPPNEETYFISGSKFFKKFCEKARYCSDDEL